MTDSAARAAFVFPSVAELEPGAEANVWALLDSKTKPPRSLGRLEELAARFGALRPTAQPLVVSAAVVVAAADHGVAEEGVSAYPQEVTAQMLKNFQAGGAAVNALCRCAGAELIVVDAGTKSAAVGAAPDGVDSARGIRRLAIRAGSGNCTRGPALTACEVEQAVQAGLDLAGELNARGVTVVGLGEMGIANTTVAALLTAVFCRVVDPERRATLVGRGTGVDDAGLARKRAAVERALALHQPDPGTPWEVMAQVGGLEIALLAGLAVGAASHRMAVLLDGFISTAAALVADAWCPGLRPYLFASHLSVEPGHALALNVLGLRPYLELELRLGEGSGAALCLPLFSAAAAVVNEMATFQSAGVSGQGG